MMSSGYTPFDISRHLGDIPLMEKNTGKSRRLFDVEKFLVAVKRQCLALGTTETAISNEIGDKGYIKDIRRGKTKNPALDKAVKIMDLLQISPEEVGLKKKRFSVHCVKIP